jgi:hypothetical protein
VANFKEDAEIAFQKSIEEVEKRVLQRFGPNQKFTPYEIDIMRFAFLNGVAWATERSNEAFSTIEK